MPERIDLNLLVALDALLRERSVSAAARRLGVGQPAMSAALSRIRALFDDPMLVRTPRGMEPTPRALEVSGPLQEALARLRLVVLPAEGFDAAASRRTFRMSGGDYVGMVLLPPLVARLEREAPGVDLRFRFIEKDRVPACLDDGEIDLAFLVPEGLPRRFLSETVFEESFVCVARRGPPLFSAPLTPEACAQERHLLVTERGDEHGAVDAVLAERGLVRRIGMTVPTISLVAGILRTTDLITTTGRRAGERLGQLGPLRAAELPFATEPWRMMAVWPRRSGADPGLRWLLDQVRDAARGFGSARAAPERPEAG